MTPPVPAAQIQALANHLRGMRGYLSVHGLDTELETQAADLLDQFAARVAQEAQQTADIAAIRDGAWKLVQIVDRHTEDGCGCEHCRTLRNALDDFTNVQRERPSALALIGHVWPPAQEAQTCEHGKTCLKILHDSGVSYLHGADDDRPYDVDGVTYCGRCHVWIP